VTTSEQRIDVGKHPTSVCQLCCLVISVRREHFACGFVFIAEEKGACSFFTLRPRSRLPRLESSKTFSDLNTSSFFLVHPLSSWGFSSCCILLRFVSLLDDNVFLFSMLRVVDQASTTHTSPNNRSMEDYSNHNRPPFAPSRELIRHQYVNGQLRPYRGQIIRVKFQEPVPGPGSLSSDAPTRSTKYNYHSAVVAHVDCSHRHQCLYIRTFAIPSFSQENDPVSWVSEQPESIYSSFVPSDLASGSYNYAARVRCAATSNCG